MVRTYDFGEADRIIVLLTPAGLVRAVAKGVRRLRSRFGSRLEPFVLVQAQLYPGRNLDTITGADTVAYFGTGIIDRYEHYTAACAVLEATERLSIDGGELFDAAVEALKNIQVATRPTLALDAFLLQAMETAGWAPQLFDCAHCNAPGPHQLFHPGAGGALCRNCHYSGCAEVDPEVLHVMWLLAHVGGEGAEVAPESVCNSAHQLVRAHLQWHLERKLGSLDFVDAGWTH
ncbi:DNA replication and repair protein RecO [Corynebacterium epidermidicanis]|uniref:DNA repair protein RecO n=1 Tax=Corynebacterium epidermidicanis TaxID=1050174 RepID=A0A0G3GSW8_9CORY|nr:DNA replication and repair protein RecO [Corynebacterium epidermidicanis]